MIWGPWIFWKGLKQVNKTHLKLTKLKVLQHVPFSLFEVSSLFYSCIHLNWENTSGEASFRSQLSLPERAKCVFVGVYFKRCCGSAVEVNVVCGHMNVELSAFCSCCTWHKNLLCLSDVWENPGVLTRSRLFSSAPPCQPFMPTLGPSLCL